MVGLSAPRVPMKYTDRLARTYRRRLNDGIEDVFDRACLGGDLETARALLDILEKSRCVGLPPSGKDG
jgi:hypothetical protein